MRSRSFLSFVGSLALLAGPSMAGTLTAATWNQVVSPLPALVPGITISRTGAQLGATGSSTATSVSVGLAFPHLSTSFFMPKTANGSVDLHIRLTQSGGQSITATPAMGGGTPGIMGTVVVMNAVHTMAGANVSMFMAGTTTFVAVPLSIGKAGTFTGSMTVVGATGYLTVDFYAWTPGTLTFKGLTTKGKALPNVTVKGSFNLTANGGGTVTLVAPSKLSANCALLQTRSMLSITSLKLTFVPEPGALLLLASAAGVLAYAARRRC